MTVTVYSRPSCAPCKTLKTWLARKGVSYTEINVDDNPAAVREILARTGFMVVPMTLIDNEAVSGPNFARLNSLLTIV
jgi:glutaredoxin